MRTAETLSLGALSEDGPRIARSVITSPAFVALVIAAFAIVLSEFLLPTSVPAPARHCLGVFTATAGLWAWGRPAPAVAALLALVLLPATGALPSTEVFSAFGSETVFFALGALLMAAALQVTGVSGRLALRALRLAGGSPARLRQILQVFSFILSLVMSEHAVAALLLPLAFDLADALPREAQGKGFAGSLCLAVAWGTTAGGIGTLLGGTRAPLALGLLGRAGLPGFGFLGYTAAALPISLCLLALGALLLQILYPVPSVPSERIAGLLEERLRSLGPVQPSERRAGCIVAVAVAAWALFGDRLGLASIGLAGAVALVAAGTVTWRDLEQRVNWGALVLIGSAVSLGAALTRSGASAFLGQRLLSGLPSAFLPVALLAATLLLTSVMSHAATVGTLLPLGLSLAAPDQAHEVALLIAVASGLGFALPASGTANALAVSAGRLPPRQLLAGGLALTVAAAVLVFGASRWLWPVLGV